MTTLCETCSKEIGSAPCPQCKEDVLLLGPFCYMCGAELAIAGPSDAEPGAGEDDNEDLSQRILCSDGACIGVIDERGFCKICGKPYVPDSD
jgi:hypothetical protein